MITMEHVCKSYKIAKRNAGFGEACKAFFHHEYEVIHALDDVSELAVRDFILKQNKAHGTTVILTTHDMQDIEALTDRIILIGKGKILMDGTLDSIKNGNGSIDENIASLYHTYNI